MKFLSGQLAFCIVFFLFSQGGLFAQEEWDTLLRDELGSWYVEDAALLNLTDAILGSADEDVHIIVPNPSAGAQWFPDAGLGLFLHWGIHSVAGAQPSWSMIKDYPHAGETILYPPERYYALMEDFNPQFWNPGKWLMNAKAAGFEYSVLTVKHHDGYALWPTRFGDLNSGLSTGVDYVEAFVKGCRQNQMKVGLYFSPRDWGYPGYPLSDVDFDFNKRNQFPPVSEEETAARYRQFLAYTLGQLQEILSNYGRIDILWFDGLAWNGIDDHHTKAVYQWIRSLQPDIVVNDRWAKVRNPDSLEDLSNFGDFGTWECHTASEIPDSWWEYCELWDRGGGWGYDKSEQTHPLEWFLSKWIDSRKWNGNFLPNVGPRPDGEMPEGYYKAVGELTEWLEVFGESLQGVRGVESLYEFSHPVTANDEAYFIHFSEGFRMPSKLFLPLPENKAKRIHSVIQMGKGKALRYEIQSKGVMIRVPVSRKRDVIKILFEPGSGG